MTNRRAACSCGQLHLSIEGEPSRISMCHCLECQRRTGAVISNQARFRREQVTFAGKATAWMRTAESGNALTFISVRHAAPLSTGRAKAFLDSSPLPSAASPTRISPRRRSGCGRSHATPGSPCRPTRRPGAWRSRGDKTPAVGNVPFWSLSDKIPCPRYFRLPLDNGHACNPRMSENCLPRERYPSNLQTGTGGSDG